MGIDARSKSNSKLLFQYFKNNVILNSDLKIDEDRNVSETLWKSRDILAQVKVYIGDLKDEYPELIDLEYDLFHNSVSISVFNFRKLNGAGIVKMVIPKIVKGNIDYEEVFYINDSVQQSV